MSSTLKVEAASRCYDVVIGGPEVFDDKLVEFFKRLGRSSPRKVLVVTDTNVAPLWLPRVVSAINRSGVCNVHFHIVEAGEKSKCISEWKRILSELAALRFTRDDVVAALGGGVVGDLAGFAASTYMRGIDWIQIPTSLLAMVDSSVGGKTGIDLCGLKNIVGSFWQPLRVFVNTRALDTLPRKWFEDGLGEVLKYSLLGAGFSLRDAAECFKHEKLQQVIDKCIRFKASVVNADEKDKTGTRACLNLGHTLGHALEKESNFKISHGIGVMLGLVGACKLGCTRGVFPQEGLAGMKMVISGILGPGTLAKIKKTVNSISSNALAEAAMHDKKKKAGNGVEIILPRSIKMDSSSSSSSFYTTISMPDAELEERFVKPSLQELETVWSMHA